MYNSCEVSRNWLGSRAKPECTNVFSIKAGFLCSASKSGNCKVKCGSWGRERGGLCVRGTEEGWSVWSTVWRSTTEWDSRGTPGRTGKGEGSRLSFYLFVADDFIEKWFPTFPCFTYHSLDDTGMPTFEITLDTWGKRPLNFLSWAVYSASSHLSFLGNSKNGCKMQKKKNTISVLEKHFSRSDISYPVKRKSSLTSWIYTG